MTLTQVTKAGLHDIALDHVFTIGASGTDHYTFQGEGLNGTVNDPTLYLTRGKTYRFENGTGSHPIRIQSTAGASGTAYNTGVTNNAGSGTVIVEVQHDAPDVLYYQCTSHANMNGIIYVTGALADGNVTTAKLADDAVTGAKIAHDTITQVNLATNAVDTGNIAANAITNAKIATDAVDTAHIIDANVTTAKLASGAVTNAKIGSGAVTNTKIQDNAITTAKIQDSQITSAKIADDAVTNAKIADGAVGGNQLGGNAVTAAKIGANEVTSAAIAAGAVGNAKIADQAVTLDKIVHGTSSNDGKFLRANNGADPTFETVTSTNISGNANNRVITGSDTANTLNGEAEVLFDATTSDFSIIGSQASRVMDLIVQNTHNGGAAAGARVTIESGSNANTGPQFGMRCGSQTWYLQSPKNAGALDFHGDGTRTFRLRNTGNVDVMTGDLTINGSGKGIDFSQGASNGTAANILDDYEEGTFTPLVGGSSNFSTYNNSGSGRYTKIGRLVDIHMSWDNMNMHNSASGDVEIRGLPFTTSNFQYSCTTDHYLQHAGFDTGRIQSWYVNIGTTTMGGIESRPDSSWIGWSVGNFTASGIYFRVHLTYMAA